LLVVLGWVGLGHIKWTHGQLWQSFLSFGKPYNSFPDIDHVEVDNVVMIGYLWLLSIHLAYNTHGNASVDWP